MAESYVAVTAGAGTKLHSFQRTIGANTVEQEVGLQGEPYLATYSIVTGAVSTATGASHPLQIMAGSSLNVYVRRIEIYQAVAVNAAGLCAFQLYRLTSAGTGGTTLTPRALDTNDAAAGCTAMFLPTAKGTEGNLMWEVWPYLQQTYGASTPQSQPITVIDFEELRGKALRIAAGTSNGICIKNASAGFAGGSVSIVAVVSEASF